MTERLGIFGGTFDPVHNGHLGAAVAVRDALELDRVVLMVARDPWQKQGAVEADASARLAMVEAAVADIDGLEAGALELERPGPTYTADTLDALAAPDRELFLILGADALAGIGTWHDPERVRAQATLVAVDRGGALPVGDDIVRVDVPRLDVSSTDIRARVHAGEPIDGLVPPAVVRLIADRGLYTGDQW